MVISPYALKHISKSSGIWLRYRVSCREWGVDKMRGRSRRTKERFCVLKILAIFPQALSSKRGLGMLACVDLMKKDQTFGFSTPCSTIELMTEAD